MKLKNICTVGVMVLLGLFFAGCDIPSKLIAPTWDVDLTVPLADKYYTIDSILRNQKYIRPDYVNNVFVIKSDTFSQTKSLVDFLKLSKEYSSLNNEVSPQNESKEIFLDFRNDQVELDSAIFDRGYVSLTIRNNSSVTVNFTATAPGAKLNGVVMRIEASVGPNSSKLVTKDLTGYVYSVPPEQQALPESFRKQFWIRTTTSSSGTPLAGEKVSFDAYISDFYFSYVKGKFPETNIGRSVTGFTFNNSTDVNSYRGKVTLSSASLKLRSKYQTVYSNPFSVKIDSLLITGKKGEQTVYLRNLDGSLYHSLVINGNITELIFDETNSNVIEFIQFLPDSIYLEASYKVVGQNLTGTFTKYDFVQFETDFSTKSKMSIMPTYLTTTNEVKLSSDERDNISKSRNAQINLELENALPIDLWGKVEVLDENKNPLFNLTQISNSDTLFVQAKDSFYIKAALVKNVTGEFVSSSKNTYKIVLDSVQLQQLSKCKFAYCTLTISTPNNNIPNPPIVTVKVSDWIRLRAYGIIKFNVNGD